MKKLPTSTIRRLRTATVIVDVHSVVKELVENALDAGATRIDVRLEGGGLKSVEVRDNGRGIPRAEVALAVAPYYTSKIEDFAALETLESYGFRGEALHSICNNCGELSILTRTSNDDTGLTTTFDHKGLALSAKPAAMDSTGTVVSVKEIFKDTPVRLQVAKSKSKDEMRRLTQLMWAYALVRPDVHLTLRSLPQIDWAKPPLLSTAAAIRALFTEKVFEQLEEVSGEVPDVASLEGFLPRGNSLIDLSTRPTNDRCFIFVNHRPVDVPQIARLVNKSLRRHFFGDTGDRKVQRRFAFIVLHISMPPSSYDVNCSPDKRQIMLHAIEPILDQLRTVLLRLYPAQDAPGFAASEAFASYAAASPSKAKVTFVNPTTHASTQLSLAQLAPRFRSDQTTEAGLDTTTDDTEPSETSSRQETRTGSIYNDDDQPTQIYGPSTAYTRATASYEEPQREATLQEEHDDEEPRTQIYGASSAEHSFVAGGGGSSHHHPSSVSRIYHPPSAAASSAAYSRATPSRVVSLDAMSSPLVQSAERSPYTSFLASIDPVRAAQLPPPAVAKRKADQLPPEDKEAEGTTHDQRSYAVNGLAQNENGAVAPGRASKNPRVEGNASSRELRVDMGIEDLSQRIASTQHAATQRLQSPSSSANAFLASDTRLVGAVAFGGQPTRGSILIVSFRERLIAVSPSLAAQALQRLPQSREPSSSGPTGRQESSPLTREAGELLLARLQTAKLLDSLVEASHVPPWCAVIGPPPSSPASHERP